MTQNKTRPTQQEISEFIDGIEDERKRVDCRELLSMMHAVTGVFRAGFRSGVGQ